MAHTIDTANEATKQQENRWKWVILAGRRPTWLSAGLDLVPRRISAKAGAISHKSAIDSFTEIATLRIDLKDTDPAIWRQVEVATSITLEVLHDIIQAAMGWFDCHL